MGVFHLTAAQVAKRIDVPLRNWPGNCYGIAEAMLARNIVSGRLVYGHWIGPIKKGTHFASRRHLGFTHHAWIALPDNRIVDPTRYVFSGSPAYVFEGRSKFYDEGGNRLIAALERPAPRVPAKLDRTVPLRLADEARRVVAGLLDDPEFYTTGAVSNEQVFWLANLPLPRCGVHVVAIYRAIIDAGHGAYLPFDNRQSVMKDK